MLTVLAVVCPPLAVAAVGRPAEAAANLGLTAFFYVPGACHALRVVGRHRDARRNDALLRALAEVPA